MPPHYKRRVFHSDQLKLVVAQIRFPIIFRFNEKSFLAPFQESIQDQYPRTDQETRAVVKFSARGLESTGETYWRFSDKAGAWSIVLGENALTLECRKFTNINDLAARFLGLAKAGAETLGISHVQRFGLRFVNEFAAKNAGTLADWNRLLNPSLVGFSGTPDIAASAIERSFSELRVIKDDGTFVVRHGLHAGTTIEPRPNDAPLESGKIYLLDMDYFIEEELPFDDGAIKARLTKYNDAHYQFFRWALEGGQLFEQLNPGIEEEL